MIFFYWCLILINGYKWIISGSVSCKSSIYLIFKCIIIVIIIIIIVIIIIIITVAVNLDGHVTILLFLISSYLDPSWVAKPFIHGVMKWRRFLSRHDIKKNSLFYKEFLTWEGLPNGPFRCWSSHALVSWETNKLLYSATRFTEPVSCLYRQYCICPHSSARFARFLFRYINTIKFIFFTSLSFVSLLIKLTASGLWLSVRLTASADRDSQSQMSRSNMILNKKY